MMEQLKLVLTRNIMVNRVAIYFLEIAPIVARQASSTVTRKIEYKYYLSLKV
jgi:hypothetical protein